jgi:hypothetical protein
MADLGGLMRNRCYVARKSLIGRSPLGVNSSDSREVHAILAADGYLIR